MIVQFLNGTQFETSLPLEQIPDSIFTHSKELGLEVILRNQISLIESETPDLCYAFITRMVDLCCEDVLRYISSVNDREERHCILDEYIQKMADEREICFSATRGRYYQVFVKDHLIVDYYIGRYVDSHMFNHPSEYVPDSLKKKSTPPDGYYVYDHWFTLGGQSYALSTIVHEEDLD
jgi:hypothetical protein